MASGKQINELTPASSVGSSDNLAIAQSGGTEAVRATVTQLSAAVAELLNDGALAELEYATSQGKALMAQVLTDKGVDTSASETLIQMADKVNSLNVDDTKENILAVGTAGSSSSSVASNTNSMCVLNANNDFIYISNNIAYYVPGGYYDSFSDMISAATSSAATNTTAASYQWVSMCVTQSGRYVWYRATSTAYCKLTIDQSTKTITNVENFTCPVAASTSYGVGVVADDNGILWINQDRSLYGRFWNTNNNWYSSNAFYLQGSQSELTGPQFVIMKDSKIFYAIPYSVSSYPNSDRIKYVPYSVDADTGEVTVSSLQYINSSHTFGSFLMYDVESQLVLYTDKTSMSLTPSDTTTYLDFTVYIVKLEASAKLPYTLHIRLYPQNFSIGNTTYVYYAGILFNKSNGVYNISFTGIPNCLTYDPSTEEFTKNTSNTNVWCYGTTSEGSTSPNLARMRVLTMFDEANNNYKVYYNNGVSYSSSTYYVTTFTITKYMNLIGVKRIANDTTAYYMANNPYGTQNTIVASGKYRADTTITPTVPDEA